MNPHHRFILHHALTIGLGITFAASLLVLAGLVVPIASAQAQQTATTTPAQPTPSVGPCGEQGALPTQVSQGTLPHGALYLICVPPTGWNGDMVVYAHGYTSVTEPLGFKILPF